MDYHIEKMKYKVLKVAIILSWATMFSSTLTEIHAQDNSSSNSNSNTMNTFVSIFEIPANDISRAVTFYQEVLGIAIEQMNFGELEMGLFPYEGQAVTGVIMKGEGNEPGANGTTIYLNGGDDLQTSLDKVEAFGGKILVPKTPHADGVGFFALFLDSEGNKMGLHSPN